MLGQLLEKAIGHPRIIPISERIRLLRERLRPYTAVGQQKIRIGGPVDGGYVMLDDLSWVRTAVSLGIGSDVSWDLDLASRGVILHQFDFSIPEPPRHHPNFRFEQTRIDATRLARAVHSIDRRSGLILKIDIEHEEWTLLRNVSMRVLDRCAQIVCEFHWFRRLAEMEWFATADAVLARLNQRFRVIHIHANNWQPLIGENGFIPWEEQPEAPVLPDVVEVSYANQGIYQSFVPSDELFPTALDHPNNPARPDHFLGKF